MKYNEMSSACTFLQTMKRNEFVDSGDERLKCMCLRFKTDDEIDHSRVGTHESRSSKQKRVGQRLGTEPFVSIIASVPVMRSNYSILLFFSVLHWSLHRFYMNRLEGL